LLFVEKLENPEKLMEHIVEAWLVDEPTDGPYVRIGLRIGANTRYGRISDAALAELAVIAGTSQEAAMHAALLETVRVFARDNRLATVPNITSMSDSPDVYRTRSKRTV
jgi:hypothetical protein